MARIILTAAAVLAGIALAAAVPSIPRELRHLAGLSVSADAVARSTATQNGPVDAHGHKGHGDEPHAEEGKIVMTADQIEVWTAAIDKSK